MNRYRRDWEAEVPPALAQEVTNPAEVEEGAIDADEAARINQEAIEKEREHQRQRRTWGKRMRKARADPAEEVLSAIDDQAEAVAMVQGKARRLALQAITPAKQVEQEHARWAAALTHDPDRRPLRWISPPVLSAAVTERSTWVSMQPEMRSEPGDEETWRQAAERLLQDQSLRIKSHHRVAHLVVSWPVEITVTPSEAMVTGRRYCARLGLDLFSHEAAGWLHTDGAAHHLHLIVARTRVDGAVWMPRLGVDRALALEARQMATEVGQEWDQRMIARTAASGRAAGMAARGDLHCLMVHPDGTNERLPWQGDAVSQRCAADPLALLQHAGVSVAKLVGFRSAYALCRYAGQ